MLNDKSDIDGERSHDITAPLDYRCRNLGLINELVCWNALDGFVGIS